MMSNTKDRINALITALDVTNEDLAGYAGFDRTNVSRLRNGSRRIIPGSSTVRKLVDGIYDYAREEGKLQTLSDVTGLSGDLDETAMKAGTLQWFFEGEMTELTDVSASRTRKRRKSARLFGDRLDLAMKWAGLSNIRLSRLMNVDASLISRFRTGVRMPKEYSDISVSMVGILWDRIVQNGNVSELSHYVNIKPDDVDEGVFAEWLMNLGAGENVEVQAVQSLLETFDSFSLEAGTALPSYEDVMSREVVETERNHYIGTEGVRLAVIRFLSSVIEEGAGEICLYSDMNMDWMIENKDFFMKWAVLMSECVKRGTRIKIIHNIDRSIAEMMEAIRSWLPLYMSGMIEPYYLDRREKERFTHTIFLCPGRFAVGSMAVSGTENEAVYHFHRGAEHLSYFEKAYMTLLSQSKPLVSVQVSDKGAFPSATVLSDQSDDLLSAEIAVPFNKIRIYVTDSLVRITQLEHQEIFFDFTHPLMCRAFRFYARRLGER